LASLRQACAWLGGLTLAGVHTVLRRARIVWKRARASIRSPDPDDDAQVADVAAAVAAAQPGRVITVYLDEVTVERQPTVAPAYAPTGAPEQARAVRSSKSNTITRIVGALNALTGGVFHRRASTITVGFLVVFYQALCRAYPDAERIYVIQDHGPVHTHPDLLVACRLEINLEPAALTIWICVWTAGVRSNCRWFPSLCTPLSSSRSVDNDIVTLGIERMIQTGQAVKQMHPERGDSDGRAG